MRRELARRREHEIGVDQQVGCELEVGHDDARVARQAQAGEVGFDDAALRRRVRQRNDMACRQVLLACQAARGTRVVATGQADDLVFEQHGQVQVLRRLRPVADHHIELALCERGFVVEGRAERQHREARPRRLATEARDRAGEEGRDHEVRRADAKSLRARCRVELLGAGAHRVDLAERAACVFTQG